ncbi:conserved hypothetical protein [Burkholderia vietnamiensis]|nr:conserved hypothetical protein [Burkholderia vietnamiensis]
MQRVLIIWTGFDKFKKGSRRIFQRHESGGIALEEGTKSFQNKEIGVASRHRSAAALRDFPIVAPI